MKKNKTELSQAQKIMKFFSSSERFEKMKSESLQWKFICPVCSREGSLWEAGGIRYKAKGKPKVRLKCPACKRNVFVTLKHIKIN